MVDRPKDTNSSGAADSASSISACKPWQAIQRNEWRKAQSREQIRAAFDNLLEIQANIGLSRDSLLKSAVSALRIAEDAQDANGILKATATIAELSGVSMLVEAEHNRKLSSMIDIALEEFDGMDAQSIIENTASTAAAVLAAVVKGYVPVPPSSRLAASKHLLDRHLGTAPNASEARAQEARELLARVQRLEGERALVIPPRKEHANGHGSPGTN